MATLLLNPYKGVDQFGDEAGASDFALNVMIVNICGFRLRARRFTHSIEAVPTR